MKTWRPSRNHIFTSCIYIFLYYLLISIIGGCGGGFQEDSSNADELEKTIFQALDTNCTIK